MPKILGWVKPLRANMFTWYKDEDGKQETDKVISEGSERQGPQKLIRR